MTNRIIFALALLGMVLTTHIWVQKQRGFDAGCLGLPTVQRQTITVSGCQEAMESDFSTTLGLDNVLAGFLFYVVMGGLYLAGIFTGARTRSILSNLRLGLAGIALVFSLYLVFILFFKIDAVCVLCLMSALCVIAIFVLQMILFRKERAADKASEEPGARVIELGVATLTSFVAAVLVVLDLVFLGNVTKAGNAGATGVEQMRAVANDVLETRIGHDFLARMAPCEIDVTRPIVDWQSLIEPTDPYMGNPGARVTFVEFFDPNCPTCKMLHPVMQRVIQRYGDRVRFYLKPYALWPKSLSQIEALWFAAKSGSNKYFALIDEQFQVQVHEGLSIDTVRKLGEKIGLDGAELERSLKHKTLRNKVMQDKQMLKAAGISSAPTLLLDGKFVGKIGQTLTVECIGSLIEKELQMR